MRHLEPKQLARREEDPDGRKASVWPTAALLIALALGGGYAATRLAPPSPADVVQQSEIRQRADDFAKAPPLKLAAVPPGQTAAAIDKMGLSAQESAALAARIETPPAASAQPQQQQQTQRMGLVEIALWDTHAPDGDVVLVTSGGYSREVLLTKTPTVVSVPGNGVGTILITGMQDGGGGITLGIKGASQSVLMPIMSVGQSIALPVVFP